MAGKNTTKTTDYAAEKLAIIGKELRREAKIKATLEEVDQEIEALKRRRTALEGNLKAIDEELSKDEKLVTAARMLMVDIMESQGGLSKATVTNPKYVTAEDKEALLERILDEYAAENPKARTMPFSTVHLVLQNKFHIVSRSAGLFFRNQLKEYETEGGNRNKKIVLGSRNQS